jgi:hypothetical protein
MSRPNAMRSWLVSGVHLFLVDPRRRFGSHGRTRELLVVEQPVRHEASERWQTLAAALHRHTVRDGLDRLSAAERRIITLAYLEGRTNREIAAMLGVSMSTVRRRLQVAVEHLDIFLRRSGAWLAALALAALTYLNGQMARGARWAGSSVGDRTHLAAATLAVGALGVAVVGFVALPQHAAPNAGSPTAVAPNFHLTTGVPSLPSGPLTVAAEVVPDTAPGVIVAKNAGSNSGNTQSDGKTSDGKTSDGKTSNGCHGNPTNAPPPTPVGPRGQHPTGPPVTHPGPGDCRAA